MIDIIKSKIQHVKNISDKINILREFLQIIILKIFSLEGVFKNIVFLGGTSLRIIYNLQRYSEDLDFSLYQKNSYNFENILKKLKFELEKNGFSVSLKYKKGTIDNCIISFELLLQELSLTKIKDQKLTIKLEIDTNPPEGFNIEDKIINDFFIFNLKVFDINSLMAGKLHAILFRKFNKGRDWYDIMWYLSKNITPNIKLLKNSIIQTEKLDILNKISWIELLEQKINTINFKYIKNDFEKFIVRKEELDLFNKDYFLSLIGKYKDK